MFVLFVSTEQRGTVRKITLPCFASSRAASFSSRIFLLGLSVLPYSYPFGEWKCDGGFYIFGLKLPNNVNVLYEIYPIDGRYINFIIYCQRDWRYDGTQVFLVPGVPCMNSQGCEFLINWKPISFWSRRVGRFDVTHFALLQIQCKSKWRNNFFNVRPATTKPTSLPSQREMTKVCQVMQYLFRASRLN